MNTGAGTFAPVVNYTFAGNPFGVVAADFNHDGYPDLAVTFYNDDVVTVLTNKGDGTFLPTRPTYAVGSEPRFLTAADFNGDGSLDLAVSNGSASVPLGTTVSVLLNTGNGTFNPEAEYPAGNSPSSVRAGDLNGDGKPDLALLNDNGVSVLRE